MVFCSIFYSIVDRIYVSLYYFGGTRKQTHENDPYFEKNTLLTFQETGITDFVLRILS